MAQRAGWRGALSGAGQGIADLGSSMMQQAMQAKGEERRSALATIKELKDKVAAGQLEPEQAAQMSGDPRYDRAYFESMQPSHEHQLKNIMSGITKAGSPDQVPGDTAMAYALPGGVRGSQGFGKMGDVTGGEFDPETGEETLKSQPMGPIASPEFQTLLRARDEKVASFPPVAVADTDTEGNKIVDYTNPTQLTGRVARPEPTAKQGGYLAGVKAITQQKTENEGGLPKLKGEATKEEQLSGIYSDDITQAKGKQEAAIQTRKGYAQLAVEGSPQAMELRRRQQSMDGEIKQQLATAGMDPSFVDNFVHHSAFGSYMYLDTSVPMEERKYVYKMAQQAAATNGVPVRFLNREQENAMSLITRAYDNYAAIVNVMVQSAPKDAAGRIVAGPANKLAAMMQTNPQLAAMATEFPAIIESAAAQMTGSRGLRIGKEIVDGLRRTVPLMDDSLEVIYAKQIQQARFLQNAANSILK